MSETKEGDQAMSENANDRTNEEKDGTEMDALSALIPRIESMPQTIEVVEIDGGGVDAVDIRLIEDHRTVEFTAWSDGVVCVAQVCKGETEAVDLTPDVWALLDVIRAWQVSVAPRPEDPA